MMNRIVDHSESFDLHLNIQDKSHGILEGQCGYPSDNIQ